MVYVKDKTVWQYKALTQFVEGGGAERGTGSSRGRMNFNWRTTLKLRTVTSCLHHLLDTPRAPTFSVVAYAVSAINGHDCGFAACHPLSDISKRSSSPAEDQSEDPHVRNKARRNSNSRRPSAQTVCEVKHLFCRESLSLHRRASLRSDTEVPTET